MIDLFEFICKSFDDFVQAKCKKTGNLEVVKMVVDGSMNPRFGDYDILQDPDLNKGLSANCLAILEEYEAEIEKFLLHYTNLEDEELKDFFCKNMTGICPIDGKFDFADDLAVVDLKQDFSPPQPAVTYGEAEVGNDDSEKEEL